MDVLTAPPREVEIEASMPVVHGMPPETPGEMPAQRLDRFDRRTAAS